MLEFVVCQKFLHKFVSLQFHVILGIMKLANIVHYSILGLVNILYHLDLLTNNFHRLLYILLNKVDHWSSEVFLQNVDILEIERETLHIVHTLYSEHSPR